MKFIKFNNLLEIYSKFKIIIFPLVVVLSSLTLIVFVIYPQIVKLLINQQAQQTIVKRSEFLEAKASVLEELDEEQLGEKLNALLGAFPPQRDFDAILGILQNIANQNGFSVSEIAVQQAPLESGSIQSYGVLMEAVGPKSLIAQLIDTVESSPRIMKVAGIDAAPVVGVEIMQVSLGIKVFIKPPPTSFGSADSPLPILTEKDEEILAKLTISKGAVQPPTFSAPRGKPNPFE